MDERATQRALVLPNNSAFYNRGDA
ncbi:hypothetical protein A2U01_0064150, partial [Trifolium medium]|nr:hypothetical protein [Trifolium medium]